MIETIRNPSGEIVYRARITRLQPDGSKKYFQKPVTKSYAQAQQDLILLKEEYPPMATGRKPGGGLGVGQLTDAEATKKFKKSIDKKFKNKASNLTKLATAESVKDIVSVLKKAKLIK